MSAAAQKIGEGRRHGAAATVVAHQPAYLWLARLPAHVPADSGWTRSEGLLLAVLPKLAGDALPLAVCSRGGASWPMSSSETTAAELLMPGGHSASTHCCGKMRTPFRRQPHLATHQAGRPARRACRRPRWQAAGPGSWPWPCCTSLLAAVRAKQAGRDEVSMQASENNQTGSQYISAWVSELCAIAAPALHPRPLLLRGHALPHLGTRRQPRCGGVAALLPVCGCTGIRPACCVGNKRGMVQRLVCGHGSQNIRSLRKARTDGMDGSAVTQPHIWHNAAAAVHTHLTPYIDRGQPFRAYLQTIGFAFKQRCCIPKPGIQVSPPPGCIATPDLRTSLPPRHAPHVSLRTPSPSCVAAHAPQSLTCRCARPPQTGGPAHPVPPCCWRAPSGHAGPHP